MVLELFPILDGRMSIPVYGIYLVVGFVAAVLLSARVAAEEGLPPNKIYDLGIYVFPSALVGSKVLAIITEAETFGPNWRRQFSFTLLFSIGHFIGGLLTALLVSAVLIHKWQLPWARTADACTPGLALANVIGRIGCFSAGCCWGKPTRSWIGVEFSPTAHQITGVPFGVSLVPTQLIEAAANTLLFFTILWFRRRRGFSGQLFLGYLLLYLGMRFVVEFWRGDPRGQILGFSTTQFISLFMIPVVVLGYCWFWYRVDREPVP